MKKIMLLVLLVFSTPLFASFNVSGGQGYGTFNLAGAGDTKAGSIMYAGVRLNDYFEIKYISLGTAIRMPVLPFRLFEVNYNPQTVSGVTSHTTYDSDVFGLNLTLPVTKTWSFSVLYGV